MWATLKLCPIGLPASKCLQADHQDFIVLHTLYCLSNLFRCDAVNGSGSGTAIRDWWVWEFDTANFIEKILYIWEICSSLTTHLLESMWHVFELFCSGIKITFNFKLKLVLIEKSTERKATYKLIQEATRSLKHK